MLKTEWIKEILEHFYDFLRGYTYLFTNNIYSVKDYTYRNLPVLIDIAVVKVNKDSSIAILRNSGYEAKLETMIHNGMIKGTYIETNDSTLKELLQSQDFLKRKFYNYEHYKDLKPDSNQPAHLYRTVKTHKSKNFKEITVANRKLAPFIYQSGTFSYNATKII